MPGKESAEALRDSLRIHLPHHLIIDEYEVITPIDDIPNDHLPTLQGGLWREIPRYLATSLDSPVYLSGLSQGLGPFIRSASAELLEYEQGLVSHVEAIADLFGCKSLHNKCSFYTNCASTKHLHHQ